MLNDAFNRNLSHESYKRRGFQVFGVQWPGFTNFTEINLRFYVKFNGERGVTFVREYVPSWIVAQIARLTYNEPYKNADMNGFIEEADDYISAEYRLRDGQNKMLTLRKRR